MKIIKKLEKMRERRRAQVNMRLGTWIKSINVRNSRRRGPIPLFLVVLIIVNGISMDIIQVEDEGKRHKSFRTNSVEFFVSRDSKV